MCFRHFFSFLFPMMGTGVGSLGSNPQSPGGGMRMPSRWGFSDYTESMTMDHSLQHVAREPDSLPRFTHSSSFLYSCYILLNLFVLVLSIAEILLTVP